MRTYATYKKIVQEIDEMGIRLVQNVDELWVALQQIDLIVGKPKTVLEIGVKDGGWLLMISKMFPSIKFALGVDMLNVPGEGFSEAFKPSFTFFQRKSQKSKTARKVINALSLIDEPLDILHIDGSHVEADVLADYKLYGPLVKKGGLILFHDIRVKKGSYQGMIEMFDSMIAKVHPGIIVEGTQFKRSTGIGILRV